MGRLQETTFVRTEEDRSGTQDIKVRAPELKQLKDRDRTTLQDILDLTDWVGLGVLGSKLRPQYQSGTFLPDPMLR